MVASRLAQVGFPVREPEKLRVALEHTHRVLWIRSIRGSRWARLGQLLGFARATSDTALSATIWDVVVRCNAPLQVVCRPVTVLPCASASSHYHPHSLIPTIERRQSKNRLLLRKQASDQGCMGRLGSKRRADVSIANVFNQC